MSSSRNTTTKFTEVEIIVMVMVIPLVLCVLIASVCVLMRRKARKKQNTSTSRTNGCNDPSAVSPTLPSYRQHGNDQQVNTDELQYDVPAAFSLATAVSVAASDAQNQDEIARLMNYECMRKVQMKIAELKRLTAAAPPEGYQPQSPQMAKVIVLQAVIAGLMEPVLEDRPPAAPAPLDSATPSAGSQPSLAANTLQVPSSAPPPRRSLHERMVEMQNLLARMDTLTSTLGQPSGTTPNGQNVHEEIQQLKQRIAELMENSGSAGAVENSTSQRASEPEVPVEAPPPYSVQRDSHLRPPAS
ncbi:hypothetical protein FA15DRAFT_697668 [Coprinopsis marcescibilis]|uniref:Transmembrane protein n=1 Tax=Coprinopsis marcescibilis TaxID=230819 RepID=A0A5C3KTR1_COPMA|nr:hypothetical protein FA15DRAFT_697668 [Coprinopsis marcescibilis]